MDTKRTIQSEGSIVDIKRRVNPMSTHIHPIQSLLPSTNDPTILILGLNKMYTKE